jgi:hypothetical protein
VNRWHAAAWIALTSLTGTGCEEDFSPKTPFTDRYFAFCVATTSPTGSSVEYALISRLYDVPGLNPAANTDDPFVGGANILLTVRNQDYVFRGAETPRTDKDRYITPFRYYRAQGVNIRARDTVHFRATLPDGRVLAATSLVPPFKPVTSTPRFVSGVTTLVNRFTQGDAWVLDWDDGLREEHLFFPSLHLAYSVAAGDVREGYAVPVPLRFVLQGGAPVPVYPSYTTVQRIVVEFDALDRVMAALGTGITDKSTIRVEGITFTLLECDFAFSRYYTSVNGYLDQYTVRLDERIFTNIHGGEGIFGSATQTMVTYPVHARYAASFGYSVP